MTSYVLSATVGLLSALAGCQVKPVPLLRPIDRLEVRIDLPASAHDFQQTLDSETAQQLLAKALYEQVLTQEIDSVSYRRIKDAWNLSSNRAIYPLITPVLNNGQEAKAYHENLTRGLCNLLQEKEIPFEARQSAFEKMIVLRDRDGVQLDEGYDAAFETLLTGKECRDTVTEYDKLATACVYLFSSSPFIMRRDDVLTVIGKPQSIDHAILSNGR